MFHVDTNNGIVIFRLTDTNVATWLAILALTRTLPDNGRAKVVLNADGLKRLSGSDLQALLTWNRYIQKYGGIIAVSELGDRQAALIEARLEIEFQNCHQTEDTAIDRLSRL